MSESKTHYKKLMNPDYLGAYALDPGQELILTIKSVVREQVTGPDGKKEECVVARFHEAVKPMVLNSTNCKTIAKSIAGTPYIEDWANRRIQIYVDKVKAFGDVVEALRIRPKEPQLPSQKETLDANHTRWAAAINALKNGETKVAGIKKSFNMTPETEKTLLSYEKK